jgi:hypothetical protein
MDFREIGWDGMDWMDLIKDRDRWRAHVRKKKKTQKPKSGHMFLNYRIIYLP